MQLTLSRVLDIHLDAFYSDEEAVVQCILAAGADESGCEAIKQVLAGAEERGMNAAELMHKAFMKYESFQKLLSGSSTHQISSVFH